MGFPPKVRPKNSLSDKSGNLKFPKSSRWEGHSTGLDAVLWVTCRVTDLLRCLVVLAIWQLRRPFYFPPVFPAIRSSWQAALPWYRLRLYSVHARIPLLHVHLDAYWDRVWSPRRARIMRWGWNIKEATRKADGNILILITTANMPIVSRFFLISAYCSCSWCHSANFCCWSMPTCPRQITESE